MAVAAAHVGEDVYSELKPLKLSESDFKARFKVQRMLGSGAFADVYKVVFDEMPAALKVLHPKKHTGQEISMFFKEAWALQLCHDRHVIKLIQLVQLPPKAPGIGNPNASWGMLVELAQVGCLGKLLASQISSPHSDVYTDRQAIAWCKDVANALAYLHGAGIIHRDVKSDNVLLFKESGTQDSIAKLADLGLNVLLSDVKAKAFLRQGDLALIRASLSRQSLLSCSGGDKTVKKEPLSSSTQPTPCTENLLELPATLVEAIKRGASSFEASSAPVSRQPSSRSSFADANPFSTPATSPAVATHSTSSFSPFSLPPPAHSSSSHSNINSDTPGPRISLVDIVRTSNTDPGGSAKKPYSAPLTQLTPPEEVHFAFGGLSAGHDAQLDLPTPKAVSPQAISSLPVTSSALVTIAAARSELPGATCTSGPVVWHKSADDTARPEDVVLHSSDDVAEVVRLAGSRGLPDVADGPIRMSTGSSRAAPRRCISHTDIRNRKPPLARKPSCSRLSATTKVMVSPTKSPSHLSSKEGSPLRMSRMSAAALDDERPSFSRLNSSNSVRVQLLTEAVSNLTGTKGEVSATGPSSIDWNSKLEGEDLHGILNLVTTFEQAGNLELVYGMTGFTGSCMYMAPEVYLKQAYNEKADVFSFGVVMYEVIGRTMLLFTHTGGEFKGPEGYAKRVSEGYRPNRLRRASDTLWSIIELCWSAEPQARPDMSWVVSQLEAWLEEQQESGGAGVQHKCGCTIT